METWLYAKVSVRFKDLTIFYHSVSYTWTPGRVKSCSLRWPTTVTAKEITSRQKKETHGKKEEPHGKKEEPRGKKEKAHSKIKNLTEKRKRLMAKEKTSQPPRLSLMPWGHESFTFAVRFFFCRESFLFAVRFFLLSWGFSFCRESFPFGLQVLPFAVCFRREVISLAVTIVSHRSSQVLLLIRWADIWHAFVPNITRAVGSLAWKIDFTVWQSNIYRVWGNTMSTTDLLYLCMLLGSIPFGHLVKLSGSPSRKQFLSTVAGVSLSLALVGVWGILHSFWTILGTYVIVISLGPR